MEGPERACVSERHPILPAGHASLALPHWTHMFEQENPGVTRQPVEVRHPFIDLRVVEFLLALPPFPYFLEKKLLRDAMIGPSAGKRSLAAERRRWREIRSWRCFNGQRRNGWIK